MVLIGVEGLEAGEYTLEGHKIRSFALKSERDPIDAQLGARLRLIRTSQHISLEELGRRIGVTYQQIQKYETGANRISASTLFKIAQAFQTNTSFFFEGLDGMRGEQAPIAYRETLQSSLAMARIPNTEVRHRLQMLIDALDPEQSH